MNRLRAGLAVLCVVGCPAGLARAEPAETAVRAAQPNASDAKRAEAEQRFQRGLVLAKAGQDWDAALLEFLESRKLFATRSATRNAAIALQHLGRFVESLAMYDALFAQFGDWLTAEQREPLRTERDALLAHIGQVAIVNSEPGTAVVIDGEQRAVTPLSAPIRLDPGVHTVRLSKDGCDSVERQVVITGGTTRDVDGHLRALFGVGTLVVSEANGEPVDVLVDAAVVGRAPFRGNIAAGLHSVLLRGGRRGTPPRAIEIKEAQVAELTLSAAALDAEITIDPTPTSATIFVDGVYAGNGAWNGALPSGTHHFEVVAPEYSLYRRDLALGTGTHSTLHAVLVRPSLPTVTAKSGHGPFYVEPSFGALLGRSLRGSTDDVCDCDTRSRPAGVIFSARAGYSFFNRLGLELSGGYMRISESATRTVFATGEPGIAPFHSNDYRDTVDVKGPFAALGVSLRSFHVWPVTARIAAGIAALSAYPTNSGIFSGTIPNDTGRQAFSGVLAVNEPTHRMTTPFVSTELRFGRRFSEHFSADLGVAMFLFATPEVTRSQRFGTLSGTADEERRSGVFVLPNETLTRPFLALSPSAAARLEF